MKGKREERRRDPRRRRTLPLGYETASIDPRDELAASERPRVTFEPDTDTRAAPFDGDFTYTTEADE